MFKRKKLILNLTKNAYNNFSLLPCTQFFSGLAVTTNAFGPCLPVDTECNTGPVFVFHLVYIQ